MAAEEVTYALPVKEGTDVRKAESKLQSAMKKLGYETGSGGQRHVSYLPSARFIAGEPTLRFAARPPLSAKDRKYITSKIPGIIDIFKEAEEEKTDF